MTKTNSETTIQPDKKIVSKHTKAVDSLVLDRVTKSVVDPSECLKPITSWDDPYESDTNKLKLQSQKNSLKTLKDFEASMLSDGCHNLQK